MHSLSNAFLQVLNMSITASIVLLVILLLRVPLKRAPRAISYVLWAVVLFRLVCPISFSSVFSFFGGFGQLDPQTNSRGNPAYVQPELIYLEPQAGAPGAAVPQLPAGGMPAESMAEASLAQAAPLQTLVGIAAVVWVIGIAAMLAYGLVSQARLRRRVAAATPVSGNIYETDEIAMPFVMGALRPRIYLPVSLSEEQRGYVLQHEEAHIGRRDHIVKPLAFLLLCVHWFNPLLWAAYTLLGKDMELRCDERVIAACGEGERAAYSRTLLQLSTRCGLLPGSPLAFGETGLKARVRNILNYRKPAFWVGIVAAVAATVAAVALIANPAKQEGAVLRRVPLGAEEIAQMEWLPKGDGPLVVGKYVLSDVPEGVTQLCFGVDQYYRGTHRGGSGVVRKEIVKQEELVLYAAQQLIPQGEGNWAGVRTVLQWEHADGSVTRQDWEDMASTMTFGHAPLAQAQSMLLEGGKRKMRVAPRQRIPLVISQADRGAGVSGISADTLHARGEDTLADSIDYVLWLECQAEKSLELELVENRQSMGTIHVRASDHEAFESLQYGEKTERMMPEPDTLESYVRLQQKDALDGSVRELYLYPFQSSYYIAEDGVEWQVGEADGFSLLQSHYESYRHFFHLKQTDFLLLDDNVRELYLYPVNTSRVTGSISEFSAVRPAYLPPSQVGEEVYWVSSADGSTLSIYDGQNWLANINYYAAAELPRAPKLGYANIILDEQGRIFASMLLNEEFGCVTWGYVEHLPQEELGRIIRSFTTFREDEAMQMQASSLARNLLTAPEGAQDVRIGLRQEGAASLLFQYEGVEYELAAIIGKSVDHFYPDTYTHTLKGELTGGPYYSGVMDVRYEGGGRCMTTFENEFASFVLASEDCAPEVLQSMALRLANHVAERYIASGQAEEQQWQGSIRLVKNGVHGQEWRLWQSDSDARTIDQAMFSAMVRSSAAQAPPLTEHEEYIIITRETQDENGSRTGTYYAYLLDGKACLEINGQFSWMEQELYAPLRKLAALGPQIPSLSDLEKYRTPISISSDLFNPQILVDGSIRFTPLDVLLEPVYYAAIWECSAGYFFIKQPDGSRLKLERNAGGEIVTTNVQSNGLGYQQPSLEVYWGMDAEEFAAAPRALYIDLKVYPLEDAHSPWSYSVPLEKKAGNRYGWPDSP